MRAPNDSLDYVPHRYNGVRYHYTTGGPRMPHWGWNAGMVPCLCMRLPLGDPEYVDVTIRTTARRYS